MTEPARSETLFQRWLDAREQGEDAPVEQWLHAEPPSVAAELREKIASFEALLHQIQGPPGGIAPGARLGIYLLRHKLGSGGMGEVWQATEEPLAREVAIKLLPPLFGLSPRARMRFARESRAVSRVEHPYALRLYAAGDVAGVPFLATELVAGGRTLEHWIADLHRDAVIGRAGYRRVTELFMKVAEGLAAVHANGILHRDLKPSNILVTRDDQPKLADFGMAHFEGAETVTATGGQIGTPRYMAPELLRESRAGSPRSDLFSYGATLYEALTGLPAFEGDSKEQVAHAILTRDPIAPRQRRSQVPTELEVLCLRCLEKEPSRRPESAAFLAEELRRILAGEPIRSRAPRLLERGVKAVRRNPWRATALGALALGLVVSTAVLQRLAHRSSVLEEALAETGIVSNLLQPASFGPSRLGVRESLRRQKERLGTLALAPERRARVLTDLGRGMVYLEEYHEARSWLEEALSISAGEELPRELQAEMELVLGWAIGRSTRTTESFQRAEQLLRRVIQDPGEDDRASLRKLWARNRLGQVLHEASEHQAWASQSEEAARVALAMHEEALALWTALERELRESQDLEELEVLALTLLDLAVIQYATSAPERDFEQTLDYCERARAIYLAGFGPEHPELAYVDFAESFALRNLDRSSEAVDLLARALQRIRRLYGAGSPLEVEIGLTRIDYLLEAGLHEEARTGYEEIRSSLESGTRPLRADSEDWQAVELERLDQTWARLSERARSGR